MDATKWEQEQRVKAGVQIQEALTQNQAAKAAKDQDAMPSGYGLDSAEANKPSEPGRSFGFKNTGGKPINVSEPIKTEPMKSALSTPATGVSGKDRWNSLVKSKGLEDIDVIGRE